MDQGNCLSVCCLSSLPARHDSARLLNSMGFETANAHLGSREAAVLLKDLNGRKANWLQSAALAMVESVRRDWEDWRKVR